MSIVRFLICAIISLGLSSAFFNSSIFAMLCIFCILEYLLENLKKGHMEEKKIPKYADKMLIAVCLLGAVLMIAGKNFIHSNACIIVGAMLFSPTIAVMIVLQVWNLMKPAKSKGQP